LDPLTQVWLQKRRKWKICEEKLLHRGRRSGDMHHNLSQLEKEKNKSYIGTKEGETRGGRKVSSILIYKNHHQRGSTFPMTSRKVGTTWGQQAEAFSFSFPPLEERKGTKSVHLFFRKGCWISPQFTKVQKKKEEVRLSTKDLNKHKKGVEECLYSLEERTSGEKKTP